VNFPRAISRSTFASSLFCRNQTSPNVAEFACVPGRERDRLVGEDFVGLFDREDIRRLAKLVVPLARRRDEAVMKGPKGEHALKEMHASGN
jgi:hypothetical protein